MEYVERYITKHDFDNLDDPYNKSNYNDWGNRKRIFISDVKNDICTEKIHANPKDIEDDRIHYSSIYEPNQKYGFAMSSELKKGRIVNILRRKTKCYDTKVYLPDIFSNMMRGQYPRHVSPSIFESNLILKINEMKFNHQQVLRR